MPNKFTIIGGGIAGLTTAIALQKAGITATLFEAAPELKEAGAGIGLGANAIKAFRLLGIEDDVVAAGQFLPSFTVYNQHGKVITKTDSVSVSKKYGLDNFTIHRAALHKILLSKTDASLLHTNKKVQRIQQDANGITVHFQDGTRHETDYLIAADGIHSAVRRQLLPASKIRYSGYTCWRAVIDNSLLQLNECSETWGANGRFGIVPLKNNQVYWFACINAAANDSRMKEFKIADLSNVFGNYHSPIPALLQQTNNDALLWGDIIDLAPLKQYAFGNILLVGDAAHATTPNLGQGACQAIEDAVVLANEIKKTPDLQLAFRQFEQRRLKRTHWITSTSHRIGQVAQLENKWLIAARDFVFSHLPKTFNDQQFKRLYNTDF